MPANVSRASPKSSTIDDSGSDRGPRGRARPIAASAPVSRQASLYLVAAAVFVLDRASKVLVQRNLPLNSPHQLFGGLVYLTHTQNTGAAFSLGLSFGSVFLVLAAIVSVGIVVYNRRIPPSEVWLRVGLGMILGGALGNALDRAVAGSVTDFIDLRWWPVFNLADSSIVVGALLSALRLGGGERQGSRA
jgi:signal peptidase II